MIEIRVHGRGGQGSVTAAELLGFASTQRREICSGISIVWIRKNGGACSGICKDQ